MVIQQFLCYIAHPYIPDFGCRDQVLQSRCHCHPRTNLTGSLQCRRRRLATGTGSWATLAATIIGSILQVETAASHSSWRRNWTCRRLRPALLIRVVCPTACSEPVGASKCPPAAARRRDTGGRTAASHVSLCQSIGPGHRLRNCDASAATGLVELRLSRVRHRRPTPVPPWSRAGPTAVSLACSSRRLSQSKMLSYWGSNERLHLKTLLFGTPC